MSVNNFNYISKHLHFDNEDQFYHLQILQRRKENPDLPSNSKVIKEYFISSVDYLLSHEKEIIQLCDMFKARASLRLNKRSYKKVGLRCLKKLSDQFINGDYRSIRNMYSKACGISHDDKEKTWILDIDDRDLQNEWDQSNFNYIVNFIESLEPNTNDDSKKKFQFTIPSKTGYHIITTPFRLDLFKKEFPNIDVHKDNPTNLYIP